MSEPISDLSQIWSISLSIIVTVSVTGVVILIGLEELIKLFPFTFKWEKWAWGLVTLGLAIIIGTFQTRAVSPTVSSTFNIIGLLASLATITYNSFYRAIKKIPDILLSKMGGGSNEKSSNNNEEDAG